MKKILSKILMFTIILVAIVGVFGMGGVDVVSAAEETYNPSTLSCASWSGIEIGGCVAIASYHILYTPSSWLLATSAGIFNSLLGFSMSGEMMNAEFVNTAWDALRGVANLLFILVLVATSISIMLDFGQFNSKNVIRDVIIIALFVNFSLFAARVVIDAGNITALGFYDAIKSKPIDEGNINTAITGVLEKDIGGSIMASFNPARLLSVESFRAWKSEHEKNDNWGDYTSLIFIFVLAALINYYTSYIFFKAGFIFVVRVVWLWVLMATAPLAFIAYIIPDLRKHWAAWWSKLIDTSFCITMFLFWIWLTLMIVQNDFFKSAFMVNEAVDFSVIRFVTMVLLQYMVVITLLGKALEYTGNMCKDGAEFGNNVFGMVKKAAGFAIPGMAGIAGAKTGLAALKHVGGVAARQTIGVGGGLAAELMKERGIGTGRVGGVFLRSARGLEKAQFGTTAESRKSRVERQAKEREEYMKTLPKEVKIKTLFTRKEKTIKPQEEFRERIAGGIIPGLSTASPVAWMVRGGDKKFVDDYKKGKESQDKLKEARRKLEKIKTGVSEFNKGNTPTGLVDKDGNNIITLDSAIDERERLQDEIKDLQEKVKPKKAEKKDKK